MLYFNLLLQEENIDLEELEQFAKTFKRRRIELGKKTQTCFSLLLLGSDVRLLKLLKKHI